MGMHNEIHQQPEVFRRILADNTGPISDVVGSLNAADFGYVVIAARGTSCLLYTSPSPRDED